MGVDQLHTYQVLWLWQGSSFQQQREPGHYWERILQLQKSVFFNFWHTIACWDIQSILLLNSLAPDDYSLKMTCDNSENANQDLEGEESQTYP